MTTTSKQTRAAILVPLLMALSACTPSVQGSVNPPGFARLRRVVVLPFTTPEGAPRSLAESFAAEMSSQLAGARFAVVDGADATGVDAVLVGRVVAYHDQATSPDLDTSLELSVRIVDVRTKEVILSTSGSATAAESFCSQEMTCLRGKLMKAVGLFVVDGAGLAETSAHVNTPNRELRRRSPAGS